MERQVFSSSGRYQLASVSNAGVNGVDGTNVLIRIGALAMSIDADEAQDFSNALRDAAAEARGKAVAVDPRPYPDIDWSQAPEWARWWAFDYGGKAYWYEEKPALHPHCRMWEPTIGRYYPASWFGYDGESIDSLRERPQ